MSRKEIPTTEWGTWEFGGPKTILDPEQLKRGVIKAEHGLNIAEKFVETDVSNAANRIRDRIRKVSLTLAEIGAFPTHEVVLDGQRTEAQIIMSDMLGRYIDDQGIIRAYTHATAPNEGIPVLNGDEPIGDMEIINTRGIWMKALNQTLDDFKSQNLIQETSNGTE